MGTQNLLSCNYGTSAMELAGYRVNQDAQTREQFGRLQTRVRVEADAVIYASSTSDLATKVAAMQASLIDGQDFIVTGAGATEFTLPAAQCQWGGPNISVGFEDGDTPFSKKIKLRLDAWLILNGGKPLDSFVVAYAQRPDGLLTVTRSGQINGANIQTYFVGNVITAFKGQYGPPSWIVSAEYEASQDAASSRVNYKLTATQLASPLPAAPDGTIAVSGSQTTDTERDEQLRLVTNVRYDLVIAAGGDAIALLTLIRPQGRVILRERSSIEGIAELRLTADFTILETADPDSKALVNFQQRLEYQPASQVWEERTYIGADPIVVRRGDVLPRLTQSGEATALGMFFEAPEQFLGGVMIDAPQITFDDSNIVEKVTRWNYSYFGLDENGDPLAADWTPPVRELGRDSQRDDYVGDVGNE